MDRIDTFTVERTIENVSGPSVTYYRARCSECEFVTGPWVRPGEAVEMAERHLRDHLNAELGVMRIVR